MAGDVAIDVTQPASTDIAVIGMAGRYPGAADLDGFWDNLARGVDATGCLPPTRWDWQTALAPDALISAHGGVPWGAFVDGLEEFEPEFFGFEPAEAARLDPQLRLFFEVAWETLENAGYAGERLAGSRTGLWVGYSHDHYYHQRLRAGGDDTLGISLTPAVANRFSAFVDWRGPSIVVNTLCSSSLVAIHMAVQSLLAGECDQALAGGVHAALSLEYYATMRHVGGLSPTRRCRPFDASADGYVAGEGAGSVLLKPLAAAQRDRDYIWAVIKGSAVNHSGRSGRLFALNLAAQTDLVREALKRGNVSPETVSYVEAHAVGTRLGDAIEVLAMTRAFQAQTKRRGYCALGSLKSGIGHLESAAGVASLHKVILSLAHRALPPTIGLERINAALNLEDSPFILNDRLRAWEVQDGPRRACLSAFGMYGVNAHVVVEEAPSRPAPSLAVDRPVHVLALSARSEMALTRLSARYAAHARTHADESLADMCYTAGTGRAQFTHRLALTAATTAELREKLEACARGAIAADRSVALGQAGARPRLAFLFPDSAAGVLLLGKELYQTSSAFRVEFGRCSRVLQSIEAGAGDDDGHAIGDLSERGRLLESALGIGPDSLRHASVGPQVPTAATDVPALFALQCALAACWRSWGVEPDAVRGHGVGRYAAAYVSGVLDLEEGLRMVLAPDHGSAAAAVARTDSWLRCLRGPDQVWTGPPALDQANCRLAVAMGTVCGPEWPEVDCTLSSLAAGQDGWSHMLGTLGRLWVEGVPIDWEAFDRDIARNRVPLPAYPFERRRYWLDLGAPIASAHSAEAVDAPARPEDRLESGVRSAASIESKLERLVLQIVRRVLPEVELVGMDTSFLEAGFNSIQLMEITRLLAAELEVSLSPILLFEHSTMRRLVTNLLAEHRQSCETLAADNSVRIEGTEAEAPLTRLIETLQRMTMQMERRIAALEDRLAVKPER